MHIPSMNSCTNCGKSISGKGKTGLCQSCHSSKSWNSAERKIKRRIDKFCIDCSKKLHKDTKGKRCISCTLKREWSNPIGIRKRAKEQFCECGIRIRKYSKTGFCGRCARLRYLSKNKPGMYGRKAINNPAWRGGGNTFWHREARRIAREHGLYPNSNYRKYIVHHIDGDITNNHPNNLLILKPYDHSKLHMLQKQYS